MQFYYNVIFYPVNGVIPAHQSTEEQRVIIVTNFKMNFIFSDFSSAKNRMLIEVKPG